MVISLAASQKSWKSWNPLPRRMPGEPIHQASGTAMATAARAANSRRDHPEGRVAGWLSAGTAVSREPPDASVSLATSLQLPASPLEERRHPQGQNETEGLHEDAHAHLRSAYTPLLERDRDLDYPCPGQASAEGDRKSVV